MKKVYIFAALVLTVWLAAGTFAFAGDEPEKNEKGVYLKYSITTSFGDNKMEASTETYIAGDRVATVMKTKGAVAMPDNNMRMVVDLKNKRILSFNDEQKSYTVMEANGQKPKERVMPEVDPSKFITATGEKKMIGKWNCEKYTIKLPDAEKGAEGNDAILQMFKNVKMEIWITKDMPKSVSEKIAKMNDLAESISGIKSPVPAMKDGIPVQLEMSMGGDMKMSMVLQEFAESKDIPAEIISTNTEGYKEMEDPGEFNEEEMPDVEPGDDGDDDDDDFGTE